MAIEMSSDSVICTSCGTKYGRRKGNFAVSYAGQYRGLGYLPICKTCVDAMYAMYLKQSGNSPELAVRQICRKLDLYWNKNAFDNVMKRTTAQTVMTQYLTKISTSNLTGKSYDDTLLEEGMLWSFSTDMSYVTTGKFNKNDQEEEKISDEVVAFWGPGNTPAMYRELQQRREYWMSKFPKGIDLDIGTEAIIRQICSLELDINRDRAAGKSVEKSINALNTLLGSANLKPEQLRKMDDAETALANTPMGVWLYTYEKKRPLPEIEDELKDCNGIRKYVFTWLGHLCKMLGITNQFSRLYNEEIAKYRVDKPEYDDDSDEDFLMELMTDEPPGTEHSDD